MFKYPNYQHPLYTNSIYAMQVALAVLIAFAIQTYYFPGNSYWMTFAALVVGQASLTTPLQHGLRLLSVLLLAIFIGSLLAAQALFVLDVFGVSVTFLIISGYLMLYPLLTRQQILFSSIFFITIASLLLPAPKSNLQDILLAVFMGGLIGLICALWVLPLSVTRIFKRGLVPVLTQMRSFLENIETEIIHPNLNKLDRSKRKLEHVLERTNGLYPEWVFEVGFNPGLRAGFRFFLIHLERVIELIFSIDYFAHTESKLPDELINSVQPVLKNNRDLLQSLLFYFKENKTPIFDYDLTSDIEDLEKNLTAIVPASLEFIDISPHYIAYVGLVRDLKDMRQILLQLLMALPDAEKNEG